MPDAPAVRFINRWSRASGGLTLIELLVVLVIIMTLAGVGLGLVGGMRDYTATIRTRGELAALSQGLELYRQQFGDYPQTVDTPEKLFLALTGRIGPAGAATHGQNLLVRLPVGLRVPELPDVAGNPFVDPWGHAYQYIYFIRQDADGPIRRGYVLYSFGARTATEILPARADVVPATSGVDGGSIAITPANAKNIYAGK